MGFHELAKLRLSPSAEPVEVKTLERECCLGTSSNHNSWSCEPKNSKQRHQSTGSQLSAYNEMVLLWLKQPKQRPEQTTFLASSDHPRHDC